MNLQYGYQRALGDFRKPASFQKNDPEVLYSCEPSGEQAAKFVVAAQVETEINNTTLMGEHCVGTEHIPKYVKGMSHSEGGWPRDLDSTDQEHIARYCRKAVKEEAFAEVVRGLMQSMKGHLRQNNVFDIYHFDTEFPSTRVVEERRRQAQAVAEIQRKKRAEESGDGIDPATAAFSMASPAAHAEASAEHDGPSLDPTQQHHAHQQMEGGDGAAAAGMGRTGGKFEGDPLYVVTSLRDPLTTILNPSAVAPSGGKSPHHDTDEDNAARSTTGAANSGGGGGGTKVSASSAAAHSGEAATMVTQLLQQADPSRYEGSPAPKATREGGASATVGITPPNVVGKSSSSKLPRHQRIVSSVSWHAADAARSKVAVAMHHFSTASSAFPSSIAARTHLHSGYASRDAVLAAGRKGGGSDLGTRNAPAGSGTDNAKRHAAALCCNSTQLLATESAISSYIFDTNEPQTPFHILTPPAPLYQLKFAPREFSVLAGGCSNGVLALFDIRRGSIAVSQTPIIPTDDNGAVTAPTVNSTIFGNASGPITSLNWLQLSSKLSELYTCDGTNVVKTWDTRNLSAPVDTIRLVVGRGTSSAARTSALCPFQVHAALSADFTTSQMGSGRFLVGTETGFVMAVNRRGKTENDRFNCLYGSHHGPVTTVQKHPTLNKVFATCADWTVKIWSEESASPVFSTPYLHSAVTDVQWHPLRPSMFACSLLCGTVQFWDLAVKHDKPVASLDVSTSTKGTTTGYGGKTSSSAASKYAFQSQAYNLCFNHNGTVLACGMSNGEVRLVAVHPEWIASLDATLSSSSLSGPGLLDGASSSGGVLDDVLLSMATASGETPAAATSSPGGAISMTQARRDFEALVQREVFVEKQRVWDTATAPLSSLLGPSHASGSGVSAGSGGGAATSSADTTSPGSRSLGFGAPAGSRQSQPHQQLHQQQPPLSTEVIHGKDNELLVAQRKAQHRPHGSPNKRTGSSAQTSDEQQRARMKPADINTLVGTFVGGEKMTSIAGDFRHDCLGQRRPVETPAEQEQRTHRDSPEGSQRSSSSSSGSTYDDDGGAGDAGKRTHALLGHLINGTRHAQQHPPGADDDGTGKTFSTSARHPLGKRAVAAVMPPSRTPPTRRQAAWGGDAKNDDGSDTAEGDNTSSEGTHSNEEAASTLQFSDTPATRVATGSKEDNVNEKNSGVLEHRSKERPATARATVRRRKESPTVHVPTVLQQRQEDTAKEQEHCSRSPPPTGTPGRKEGA